MAADMCRRRLQREYVAISKSPPPLITTSPNPENILEWHYLISIPDAPYSGGLYWGKLVFPPSYPLSPPSVMLLTPNGRFHTNRRLCLSMSDYHPETWNPMWSVSTVLLGLQSFWQGGSGTLGSVSKGAGERERMAKDSMDWNCRQKKFKEMFPKEYEAHIKKAGAVPPRPAPAARTVTTSGGEQGKVGQILAVLVTLLVAVGAVVWRAAVGRGGVGSVI